MSKKQNNVGPNGRSVLTLRPLEQKAEKTLDEVSDRLTKNSTPSSGSKSPIPKLSEPLVDQAPSNLTFGEVENILHPTALGVGDLLDRPETETPPPFTPPGKLEVKEPEPQAVGYVYVIIHKTSVAVFETPNEVTPGRIKSIIISSLSGGVFGLDVVGRWATLAIDATRELTTVKTVLDGKVESLNGQYHIWSKNVAEAVINDMVATGQWVKVPTNYMNSVDDKELCPVLRFTHVENKNALSQPKTT
ncbi:hypothetical protein PP187_gp243 [Klebsiella phage vB_KvM-Eowyn]|uniref:Uncharacterized protein n=1 Tax=Klebsiella phage vB_KvM-Eowyn TaxID=2762819 RepID=A0A7R8MJM8_9CAUD|nr:hypothetical protein PP187_gp243 [Klebsiella phage vB_KvM-Eowyn]CAD5236232.1 hypothetical protein LLCLJKAH_00243 [Klebsiella phage vB_KvM-Eowyn]